MQKFFLHPSWAIIVFSVGVLAGDILIHLFRFNFFAPTIWLFVALVALIISIKIPSWLTLPLALISGIIMISFRAAPDFISVQDFAQIIDHHVVISGTVAKDPDKSENKISIVLQDPTISDRVFRGKIYINLPSKSATDGDIHRSDRLILEGKPSPGFGTYLAYLYHPTVKSVTRPEPGDFFLDLRDNFASQIRKFIPDDESGLALGYLLAIRSGVDDNFEETLRTVGLTHIIVASGTHLSILVSFARKIFGRFSRFAGLFSALIFIASFVGITGFTPSMTRAALVSSLGLIAWYFGRKFVPWRLLLIAVAITLLISPTNLCDLAWLLSFASFSGIMLLSPALTDFFFGHTKKPGLIAETVLSSLSASLLCTPILIYFYGSFSLISIFANVLILPTISIVLGLTLLTGLFACINFSPLAWATGQVVKILIDYHINVVNFLGSQKYFLLSFDSGNPVVFVFLIFLTLFWLVRCVLLRRHRRRVITPEHDTS